ncbi:MAG: FAD-binding oxidoreductase [Burkholderiales bacterium]
MIASELELTRKNYYHLGVPREREHAPLAGEQHADVCVVGGGLAGLSAALELADRGYQVIVLEGEKIGWGASGRNGGQSLAGVACDNSVIEKAAGFDIAKHVWDISLEALDLVRSRIKQYDIACDYVDGYLSLAVNQRKANELRQWHDDIQTRYAYKHAKWIEPHQIKEWIDSQRFHSGVLDTNSGHLHPLKYVYGIEKAALAKGVTIHEQSRVTPIEQGARPRVVTEKGAVTCNFVVLAGNVYLADTMPQVSARIMPVGTYIVATQPLGKERTDNLIKNRVAVCDTNFILDYFRVAADHRLLFGGRVSYSTMTPVNMAQRMKQRILAVFPQLTDADIEFAWGGFVDITMNRAPDFGRIGNNIYYLQGFSGHGLALTGMAGKLAAEAIAGQAERFDWFNKIPHHNFPGGKLLRTPMLVMAMAYYRLRDLV